MKTDARTQAFFLLNKLQQNKHTLDHYLEELDRKALLRDKRERALFNALVYGVLRNQAHLDYVLKHFSSKPLAKLDYQTLNILRLALYQIMFMDKIPQSAAVNTAVEIAKQYQPKAAGFVNAVLRKSAANHASIALPDPETHLHDYLAVKYSLPAWLVKRWLKRFGRQGFENVAGGLNHIPPLSLRVNTLKTTPEELAKLLANAAQSVSPGAYLAQTLNLEKPAGAVYDLPGYNEGLFTVQDEAAQLSVALVNPRPGEKVLDACAGIGGKTLGLAIASKNGAQITASDLSAAKLTRIALESARLGLTPPQTKTIDWTAPISAISVILSDADGNPQLFDKILVDAPCSGLGVLRRNPDAKWSRKPGDLTALGARQLQILQNAAGFVKPGGFLVYTVCSTEPEETTAISEKFLNNNPGFIAANQNLNLAPNFTNNAVINNGIICTYPNCSSMDGFFSACFKRV